MRPVDLNLLTSLDVLLSERSVTKAARNLGMLYPSLNYMLRTRYKDLLKYRTPIQRRPRKA